jgi:hypothetical protein
MQVFPQALPWWQTLQQAAGSSESEECERLWQRFAGSDSGAEPVGAGVPATAEIDRRVLKASNVSERRIVHLLELHWGPHSSWRDCLPVMLTQAAKAVTDPEDETTENREMTR